MIHRGAAGGARDELGEALRKQVDRVCTAELRGLGSDFPYASAFDLA